MDGHARIVPKENWRDEAEYVSYLRHFASYHFAKEYTQDKLVLEIGCGAGYGTNFLASKSSHIIGVDTSEQAIEFCNKQYKKENLEFQTFNGINLPFDDSFFHVCVTFQVIEHINLNQLKQWLLEIKRVLHNDGLFIFTTPNKKIRLLPLQKTRNISHTKEYDYFEIKKLLEKIYSQCDIYGLFGTQEIHLIEKQRLKQNPWQFYIIKPGFSLFKKICPPLAKRLSKKLRERNLQNMEKKPNNDLFDTERYSVEDFKLKKENFDQCLDFFGLCKK